MSEEVVGHSILLGGCGGDSHSVGLTILKTALADKGYSVYYIGTQNDLIDFFEKAIDVSAVFISSMDGHAEIYLKNFVEYRLAYSRAYSDKLWFLGGNLCVNDTLGTEKKFIEQGFHRVYTSFVDIEVVLDTLEKDLEQYKIPKKPFRKISSPELHFDLINRDESREYLDNESLFLKERKDVLNQWKTGNQCENLAENAYYLKNGHSLRDFQERANDTAETLIQPRSGVADISQQINYFTLFNAHGAGVLSYQVDSLTRNNNYIEAEAQIKESHIYGISKLNGFPVVNYGPDILRKVSLSLKTPLQVRHSTRDPRLLAEISYASGVSAFEGGPICYNIPYYKNYSLSESVRKWRYVDHLTGVYYDKFGLKIDREYFGCLTATLIPPSLAISIVIIESMFSAEQGVRSVSFGYAEQGNRWQDIAAIRAAKKLAKKWHSELGFKDVDVYTAFYQYMAAFPQVFEKAEELIYESAITAGASGANRILTKTAVEAFRVPSMADNLEGISIVQRGLRDSKKLMIDEEKVQMEQSIIEEEVDQILTSILEIGGGNISKGIVLGFKNGLIDVPFSPSLYNNGEVLGLRDNSGAVRFAKTGNLSFSKDVIERNKSSISDRLIKERVKKHSQLYKLIEKDVLRIARSQYEKWPLSLC